MLRTATLLLLLTLLPCTLWAQEFRSGAWAVNVSTYAAPREANDPPTMEITEAYCLSPQQAKSIESVVESLWSSFECNEVAVTYQDREAQVVASCGEAKNAYHAVDRLTFTDDAFFTSNVKSHSHGDVLQTTSEFRWQAPEC